MGEPLIKTDFVRSSYAVKPHVHEGLPGLLQDLNVKSLAQLLTMLVDFRPQVVAALAEISKEHNARRMAADGGKAQRRELMKQLESKDPEVLQRLLEQMEQGST